MQHAIQFSQSYKYKDKYGNIWNGNTNAMHLKGVLKQILSKYGVLSVEMQQALNEDIEPEKKDKSIKEVVKQESIADSISDNIEEIFEIK